jgi:hypothetical protein
MEYFWCSVDIRTYCAARFCTSARSAELDGRCPRRMTATKDEVAAQAYPIIAERECDVTDEDKVFSQYRRYYDRRCHVRRM